MSDSYEKINTFSRTPSAAQIISYLIVIFQSVTFYAFIQPTYSSQSMKIVFNVLYSVSLIITIITTAICSCIDPSDTILIQCKKGRQQSAISGVKQIYECQYCKSFVSSKARHCRQCDRCVENFDHHCIWINNCVGKKNYKPFLWMIFSTLINFIIYIVAIILLTVEDKWQRFLGFMIPSWVVLAIVSVFFFLLLNLIILHIYLICKGYTTYQFIMVQRQEEKAQKFEQIRQRKEKENRKYKQIFEKQQQKMKDKLELKMDDSSLVKVRKQESQQKIEQNQMKMESVIMKGQIPKKVVYEEQVEEEIEKTSKREEDENSQAQSVVISQFFTKNKSFKFFIDREEISSPKRILATSMALPTGKNSIKKKSMKIQKNSN